MTTTACPKTESRRDFVRFVARIESDRIAPRDRTAARQTHRVWKKTDRRARPDIDVRDASHHHDDSAPAPPPLLFLLTPRRNKETLALL
jgi:hypothetical protein